MALDDMKKTAIIAKLGLYEWNATIPFHEPWLTYSKSGPTNF